jgi:hypothetical protein
MKKIYIILNIFFWMTIINYSVLLAQPNAGSVSSSSMGTAVGEFTGTLNLNFPLASVSNGNVGAGLSLGYVGTGYKPNSPSSEVGMDWYMSTGFSVTRQVMHMPDEFYYYTEIGPQRIGDGLGENYDYERIRCRFDDGESDLYTFNGFGQSINFTIDRNNGNVLFISKTEIKVIPSFTSFSFFIPKVEYFDVINVDGTVVRLLPIHQNIENIKHNGCSGPAILQDYEYTTSWAPTKIEAYDLTSNTIDFIYDQNFRSYQFQSLDNDVIKGKEKQLISIIGLNDTINLNYVERFDINSIGSNGVQGKLDQIFYKNSNLCYYYQLQSDYYGATGSNRNQIRLSSIQKKSCDNTLVEPIQEFSYFSGLLIFGKNYVGVDHWGFMNGQGSNDEDNMLPSEFGGNSNRNPDTSYVVTGNLKFC